MRLQIHFLWSQGWNEPPTSVFKKNQFFDKQLDDDKSHSRVVSTSALGNTTARCYMFIAYECGRWVFAAVVVSQPQGSDLDENSSRKIHYSISSLFRTRNWCNNSFYVKALVDEEGGFLNLWCINEVHLLWPGWEDELLSINQHKNVVLLQQGLCDDVKCFRRMKIKARKRMTWNKRWLEPMIKRCKWTEDSGLNQETSART